jgi:hypothetical protein
MSLNKALVEGSTLRPHVKAGCGAIAAAHRAMLTDDLKQTVHDSMDLDTASSAEFPQSNRWDYVVAVRTSERLVGIEPHSARDDQVTTVIAKKRRSAQFLIGHLKPGTQIAAWIWVASGPVRFSRMDPAIRRLDQNGIRFAGKIIRTFET